MLNAHETAVASRAKRVAVMLGLALVSLMASLPGLSGSWVHDDINMLDNPHYSGIADVLAVPARHSGDYAKPSQATAAGSMTQTYRPVTMLTLVATQVLAPVPWVHHGLGWLLHLLTAWVFYVALRRSDPRASSERAHALLAALFLLHPVGVETYVWINGRSDLVAGLWLASLLVALGTERPISRSRAACIFGIGLLGSASKETFVPAALLTAVGLALAYDGGASPRTARLRRIWSTLLPLVLGIFAYALARSLVLPDRPAESIGQAGNPFASAVGWLFLPKLAAIASHALLSMRAANMQSLGWDQVRALSIGEQLCGLLSLLGIFVLLRARDVRGLWLIAAAGACLAPVVLVMFAIWLGLDRYLYMPLMLLLFAASPYAVRAAAGLELKAPRLVVVGVVGMLAVAASNTFVASRAYASQATWLSTLARERPEDPSVTVFLATELGQPRAASYLLQRLPPPPWPSSVIAPLISLALASGDRALARRVAEYGTAHYPTNPLIVALTFRLRYVSGSKEQALALLPTLSKRSSICGEVRAQLRLWAERREGEEREQLTAAMARLRCER